MVLLPLVMLAVFVVALVGIVGWALPVIALCVLSALGLWHGERDVRRRRRSAG